MFTWGLATTKNLCEKYNSFELFVLSMERQATSGKHKNRKNSSTQRRIELHIGNEIIESVRNHYNTVLPRDIGILIAKHCAFVDREVIYYILCIYDIYQCLDSFHTV